MDVTAFRRQQRSDGTFPVTVTWTSARAVKIDP